MNTQVIQPTIAKNSKNNKYAQPTTLYNLFFIELWERFAYYGMQILLVFFIGETLQLSSTQTIELNGAFLALLHASPTFGGFIADRYLGIKRTLMLGVVFLICGYIFLGIVALPAVKNYFIDPQNYLVLFFWALGTIVIGNGCFKPNPTSLLSKVYEPNDPRIDAGYTIFYMAINIGSLFSLILTPIIHANFGYTLAFLTCAVGLMLGFIYFSQKIKNFAKFGVAADFEKLNISTILCVGFALFFMIIIAAYLLAHLFYAKMLIATTVVCVISMMLYFSFSLPKQEGQKIWVILILLFFTAIFFSLQLQMYGVLNLFINEHVDKNIMGINIPTGNYGALNALWVALLGPLMAKIYIILEKKGLSFSIPTRFTLGLFIGAIGFYYLSISSNYATDGGIISSWWIVISYGIISLGEILVSALGLALICKLAPPKLTTIFMGAFLLSIAIGGWISGLVGHWVVIPEGINDMEFKLDAYNAAFFKVGHMALITGIISTLLVPMMVRFTGEKNTVRR